ADRPRRHDGVERIVLQAVAVLRLVEMQVFLGHGCALVIPGWCASTRPGISRFRVRCLRIAPE
ncbi:hypothetical protein chiPu_0031836, partial [Chiloscyllium punctatum]|nr:hypothetical protein [Chiloscyllium punctatum]